MKDQPKDTAGNDLASTYSQHHQWDRKINAVSIVKYERHDHCIGDDRWKRGKEPIGITQLVSKNCAQQCGNASEDDVYRDTAAQDIGNDTSYK